MVVIGWESLEAYKAMCAVQEAWIIANPVLIVCLLQVIKHYCHLLNCFILFGIHKSILGLHWKILIGLLSNLTMLILKAWGEMPSISWLKTQPEQEAAWVLFLYIYGIIVLGVAVEKIPRRLWSTKVCDQPHWVCNKHVSMHHIHIFIQILLLLVVTLT